MAELFIRLFCLAFVLSVVLYGVFVALAVLFRTARFLLAYGRDATRRFIRTASFNLALWAVWGCQWMLGRIGTLIVQLFRRVIEGTRPEDPEQKKRELAALSNGLKDARGILGLGERFSKDDLKGAYRRAAKQVAPESGGTEGLLRVVNLARDVLKPHAS
jgi:hypothetical protein